MDEEDVGTFVSGTIPGKLMSIAEPLEKDTWVYRITVVVLGLTILGSVIGMTVLAFKGIEVPSGLVALGSVSVGGLVGLLSPVNK